MAGSGAKNGDDDKARTPKGDAQPPADAARQPAKRSYIQRLAHELKTPISAIVAASEVMRDERLGPIGDERYRRYAADIHDSSRLMLAVIDRMMGQRSRDPDLQALDFADLDPVVLLQATVSALLPLAQASSIKLRVVEPASRLPALVADEVSIKQILINLINNALKFTPAGGSVTVTATHTDGGPVALVVRDTGPGMSADDLAAALKGIEPAGNAPPARGLGVGLPLVQTLAAANGARLVMKSSPGAGTEAAVVFPADRLSTG